MTAVHEGERRRWRWLTAVALATVLGACSADAVEQRSAVRAAPAVANSLRAPASPRSLGARIASGFEGVQLDVYGGGDPAPGGTTTMFIHHGDWAAEMYWKTDGWCLSRVYRWRILDAVSESQFVVDYSVVEEHDECVQPWGAHLQLSVSGAGQADDRVTFAGAYTEPREVATVRTVCSSHWDDPSPCGFSEPAALRPTQYA